MSRHHPQTSIALGGDAASRFFSTRHSQNRPLGVAGAPKMPSHPSSDRGA
jgi:hypothetical protein